MRCHSVAGRAHTRTVDSIFEYFFCSCPSKFARPNCPHDPARRPRFLSAGDLRLSGSAGLSKDAGSLIQLLETQSAFHPLAKQKADRCRGARPQRTSFAREIHRCAGA